MNDPHRLQDTEGMAALGISANRVAKGSPDGDLMALAGVASYELVTRADDAQRCELPLVAAKLECADVVAARSVAVFHLHGELAR